MSIAAAYDAHDAVGLAGLVVSGQVTPDELLTEALRRADALNPKLNALTLLRPEAARARIAEGLAPGPLRGVPFLLKDLGAEATDLPCNSGSRLAAETHAATDSHFVERLRAAGLVMFGRTASPEFGVGPATEAAVYGGPTRNPWNLDHTPGGSSGGAGAAVAAGIVPAAHASDGAGSIRIPAASSGLYGLKPSRGLLPNGPSAGEGWAGLSSSGFVTRTVRDTAVLLEAVAGSDLGAPYAAPGVGSFPSALHRTPGPLRIGILTTDLSGNPIHDDCAAAVADAGRLLESLGHHVEPAPLPETDIPALMRSLMRIIACGSALTIGRICAAKGIALADAPVEPIARGALTLAQTVSGADYLADVNALHACGRDFARWMSGWDVMLTATLAEPPAKIGRFAHKTEDFMHYRLGPGGVFEYSPFTAAFNASGQPAASLPLSFNAAGLPIGVHLAMPFGRDADLLALSAQIEAARPFFPNRPPLTA